MFYLFLQRRLGMQVVETYIPTIIIVCVSWLSFLIPPEAYPGRIGLLLTTLLVLVNIFIEVMENTPISGGINQIQLWLLFCIGYVFLAVLIYAIILCEIQHKSCYINSFSQLSFTGSSMCHVYSGEPRVSVQLAQCATGNNLATTPPPLPTNPTQPYPKA